MAFSKWRMTAAAAAIACFGGLSPASADETRLIVATLSPPGSDNITKFFTPWADSIAQHANGSVALDLRAGVAIANHSNIYERVMADVVQIGWVIHGEVGGRFQRTEVAGLPFIVDSAEEGSIALWRLYKTGLLDAEYDGIVPLVFDLQPQAQLHFVKKPTSLDTLKGLRIGASTKVPLQSIEQLQGTPLSVAPGEFYESLQHGAIDGLLTAWAGNSIFKYSEVTSYHVDVNLGTATGMLFMTKAKFDALSPDAQKALLDYSGGIASRNLGHHLDILQSSQRSLVANASGQTVITMAPEQEAAWRKMAEPLFAQWAASRPNGQQIIGTYRSLVKEVRAELSGSR